MGSEHFFWLISSDPFSLISSDPFSLIIHAVPGRSIALLFLLSLYLIIGAGVFSVVI